MYLVTLSTVRHSLNGVSFPARRNRTSVYILTKESKPLIHFIVFFFFWGHNIPKFGLGRLIVEVCRSHPDTDTPSRSPPNERSDHGRGCYLQNTQQTREQYSCPQRDSNPRSQQSSGFRPPPKTWPPIHFTYRTQVTLAPIPAVGSVR